MVFPLASTILMQPLLPVLSRQPQSTPAKSNPPTTLTTAAVDRFFTIYIFVLLGLALPWQQWLELGWKGLLLVVAVLLLRRSPAFLLLRPLLGQLKSWQDTLFLG